uniref:Uncharacterized protein n=1 Tax=Arundo donax TaxID=35708 RepID=A0A0A9AWU1_ARUDO
MDVPRTLSLLRRQGEDA